jgi:predicted regulator of Ras-like GTPase activity (Roadblock/LC7/MglB family)
MKSLPQLIESDIRLIDAELQTILEKSAALAALVVDEAGFVLTSRSSVDQFDLTTIGALASGAFLANQSMAALVRGNSFTSVYQQGREFSMFIVSVDEFCLLVIIFKAAGGVGIIKHFTNPAAARLATGFREAAARGSGASSNLPSFNMSDIGDVFGKGV